MHNENCFVTLTYNDEHLPQGSTLQKKHFPKFIRALRKKYPARKFRYYMCGEYGENEGSHELGRPHYHALIFGFEPPDMVFHHTSGKSKVFTSEILSDLWGRGFVTIGSVSFQSAGYVARYTMKKVNGKLQEDVDELSGLRHYERQSEYTGEITSVEPEYTNMSLKHGIGYSWFMKYSKDVFPSDEVIIEGKPQPTPRYYDFLLKQIHPDIYNSVKAKRLRQMAERADDNTYERLETREICAEARLTQLKRPLI